MKNKLILIPIIILLFFISCNETRHVPVYITVQDKDTIDFTKYEKILYMDLKIKSLPKDAGAEKVIKNFFLKELSQILKKDIESMNQENMAMENSDNKDNLKNIIKEIPNALLITGELECEIKSRSRVKEVKDKSGKKVKKFIKIQDWRVKLDVSMVDSNSGETVFKNEFTNHMREADPQKAVFNFKSLFDNVADKFLRKIKRGSRKTRRFLLTN